MTMRKNVWAWVAAFTPVVVYNLLPAVFFPAVFGLVGPVDPRTQTAVLLGAILVVELMALGLLLLWLRLTGRSLANLGWGRPTPRFAVVAAVTIAAVYSAFTLSSPVFGSHAAELSLFKVWGAFAGVIGGVVEELVFRGFVMTTLEEAGVAPAGQVVASGLSFSLIHGAYSLLRGPFTLVNPTLFGLGFTFILGLALAWLYLAGRRSLTGPVLAHGLINLLIEPWLMLGFVTFSHSFRY